MGRAAAPEQGPRPFRVSGPDARAAGPSRDGDGAGWGRSHCRPSLGPAGASAGPALARGALGARASGPPCDGDGAGRTPGHPAVRWYPYCISDPEICLAPPAGPRARVADWTVGAGRPRTQQVHGATNEMLPARLALEVIVQLVLGSIQTPLAVASRQLRPRSAPDPGAW